MLLDDVDCHPSEEHLTRDGVRLTESTLGRPWPCIVAQTISRYDDHPDRTNPSSLPRSSIGRRTHQSRKAAPWKTTYPRLATSRTLVTRRTTRVSQRTVTRSDTTLGSTQAYHNDSTFSAGLSFAPCDAPTTCSLSRGDCERPSIVKRVR